LTAVLWFHWTDVFVKVQLSIELCRLVSISGTNFDSDVASDKASVSFSVHEWSDLEGWGWRTPNIPDIPTQPDRRVCTVAKFSNNFKARIENLTSSYWIKLIMAIPRKALLLEELAGIHLRTLEARNSGYVRGKFEVGTCSLTEF
jgi:hypothetical protein